MCVKWRVDDEAIRFIYKGRRYRWNPERSGLLTVLRIGVVLAVAGVVWWAVARLLEVI